MMNNPSESIPFHIAYLNQKADQILLLAGMFEQPVFAAIDGRCASGKTTLAKILKQKKNCQVIHMDDFFLRQSQRTPERFEEAGGNVDRERLAEEVLEPLKQGRPALVRRMDCSIMQIKDRETIEPRGIIVIEGSYALHPALRDYYDLKVFMDVAPQDQRERIRLRNGDNKLVMFENRWIPMEEQYFSACGVKDCADLYINTSMRDEF